jgi:hypothetical protein
MSTKNMWVFATPNDYYLCAPISQPGVDLKKYEIKPNFLNQFGASVCEDAGRHVNIFNEIFEMIRIKNVNPDR